MDASAMAELIRSFFMVSSQKVHVFMRGCRCPEPKPAWRVRRRLGQKRPDIFIPVNK
jgi:hypothetical protein